MKDVPGSWGHSSMEWYADIREERNWTDVWMVGKGLKDGGFPGGWNYSDPEEIETELLRALKTI